MSGITYTIDFAAAIARLEEGTAKASRAVRKMADEMEAASNFAKNALAAIGVGLSGAAFAAGVKSAAEAADAAAKLGDRFGIATEQMIGMQHAANLAGVSNEGLTTALRGLAKSGVEAAQGNEAARTAFERMHVQASEFIKLPMDQQLSIVIDRLGKMENAAVRNATAQAVMGRQAGEVMGLVAEGSAAFRKAAEDAEAWGLALNRIDAAKIEMANDAIKRAEAATKGVFTQIALALSPAVIALANHFADTKAEARGYRDEIASGSEIVIEAIGYAANFIHGLQLAWMGARLAAAMALQGWVEIVAFITDNAIARRLLGVENVEAIQLFAESAAQNVARIREELEAFAALELPADEIIAKIRKVQATLDEDAKRTAARRQALSKQGADTGITPFDSYTAALAQQLGALLDHNRTEEQVLRDQYNRRQALLDESVEKGLITQELWEGQSALLGAEYEVARTKLLDEELKKRYGISNVYHQLDLVSASAFFGAMGAMMSSHNRAAFNIGKAAAISQTVIDTYRAAQGAYAAFSSIPYVGPALGIAAAAAAIVAGLARVQQIRSTQFGGGSVSGGATGTFSANPVTGVPTAPISPVLTPPSLAAGGRSPIEISVTILNNGGVLIGEGGIRQLVEDHLAPVLGDLINDNDLVIIGANSRQAANLVPAT